MKKASVGIIDIIDKMARQEYKHRQITRDDEGDAKRETG